MGVLICGKFGLILGFILGFILEFMSIVVLGIFVIRFAYLDNYLV